MRVVLSTILLLAISFAAFSQPTPAKKTPADVMREIRLKVLSTPSSQISRKPTEEFPHVDGIIMDWPIKDAVVSVMGSSVGDGSIYTTGDFGVLGGIKYEKVRDVAKSFVKLGEKYYSEAVPTTEYPYPKTGRIRFYLMCYDGVRVLDVDANALASGKGKYLDLFGAGERLIGELRQISQEQKK